jgi:signal transduction histidine kinase/CheY-like chemotaxis protein/HPt (histidine-containing phosphotransfer) domain-containing protein
MTAATTRHSLNRKLLRIVFAVFFCVAASTVSVVTWLSTQSESRRLADIESQVRANIASKANVLVDNHALALRGLVADNAFTDVRQIVERAVEGDPDIIYGVFVAADGSPLAYSSPTTKNLNKNDPQAALEHWQELSLPPGCWKNKAPSQRNAVQFEQQVFEVARPVVDEGEVLGMIRYGFSTKPLREALAQVRAESRATLRTMLVWMISSTVLSTLLGFYLVSRASSKIVEPLRGLTAAAESIAAGQQGVRVDVRTDDELQVLGQAFNHMQQANEDAQQRLRDAMEAALEASRLKSEFLANMSHEIRTPMNGVIGMIRLILKMPLEGKLRRYAETVDASASALMTIINDVLDFSKMEAGKYTLQSVPFDPGVVLQEAAELLSNRAIDKRLELVYRRAPNVPQVVKGDPDRYRQILNNLVGNAIKFSDHGEVFVDLTLDEADETSYVLRTVVQDTGIGISPEDQAKLFSAFSQVDGSMVRRYGGTGLGLAISKRLVEMMGGKIDVVSERGVGSKFWFTIRVSRSAAPTRPSLATLPDGRRALVVEASRRWSRIIEEHMQAWGLKCELFQDGRPALERLHQGEKFDVAIIGAQLLDISIEAFVKELRAIPAAKELPLIVLTQLGATATLTEVEKEVAAQVSKPLRLSELYDCIVGAFAGGYLRSPGPRPRERSVKNRGKRILIVDDNDINQFVAVEQVEQAGFEADVASNGEQAVERAKVGKYAAILMDCQMPIMDGYAATRAIRDWEAGRFHTPIIALTAHAMAGERDKVLAAGMDDYLSKPLRPHSLERMLERYVGEEQEAAPPVDGQEEPRRPLAELDMTIDRSPRLVSLFIARVPENLAELEAVLALADCRRVREKAHKLKGSCLAVGAELMAHEAEALQFEAERDDLGKAAAHLDALKHGYQRVCELLRNELPPAQERALDAELDARRKSVAPPAS